MIHDNKENSPQTITLTRQKRHSKRTLYSAAGPVSPKP